MPLPERPRVVLFDLDGTLYIGDTLIPGAAAAIDRVEAAGVRCRYLTNTTRKAADTLHRQLTAMGLPVDRSAVTSSVTAAVSWLREHGSPSCHLLVSEDAKREFAEFPIDDEQPEVVVIGDIGPAWTYDLMSRMFELILNGAEILALHKGRFWKEPDGLRLDIGPFVAGLEYATGKTAEVAGKPSPAFFRSALAATGVPAEEAVMVGDDIRGDIGGAQQIGMAGVLVRTGKYRDGDEAASGVRPDRVIDSVADLPDALGIA